MLRVLFAIVMLLAVGFARADNTGKPQIPGGGAADLLNNTKFDPDKLGATDKKKSTFKLSANCSDSTGKTSIQGDDSFDRCVADKQSSAARPGDPANGKPMPVITFGK